MNNTTLFLVTVYVTLRAVAGRAATKVLSHQTVKVGLEAAMSYIASLDDKSSAEVREISHAELFTEYNELARAARTAGLVQGNAVTDRTGTYGVPTDAANAAGSYRRMMAASQAMMAGCKVRARRAELESIHDRAKRLNTLMSDIVNGN